MVERESVIILIDDDIDDLEIFEAIITSFQPERKIRTFETPNEFLNYINTTSETIYLILCDINMPQMNGLELRREIVKDKDLALKCYPFVFFSTFGSAKAVSDAYLLPVHGYFEKPSSYKELNKVLIHIVKYWSHNFLPSQ